MRNRQVVSAQNHIFAGPVQRQSIEDQMKAARRLIGSHFFRSALPGEGAANLNCKNVRRVQVVADQ